MEALKNFIANHETLMIQSLVVLFLMAVSYLVIRFFIIRRLKGMIERFRDIKVPLEILYRPSGLLFILIFLVLARPLLAIPEGLGENIDHLLRIFLISGVAWLMTRLFRAFKETLLSRYRVDVKDNLKARQVSTQLMVLQRVFTSLVLFLAIASALLTFQSAREIGLSLLASAGIAGIIIGLAAQKSLATLFAGIQLAITQPIRIDDVVIIENEWGRIEEITLTYAVVRIWDERRLVVPITHFIDKPFQNWTRTRADILGTVYLFVDYHAPLEPLRLELDRIVKDSKCWDGRVASIQVTGTTDRTVELRALVSAKNSSNAWDLRCLVREGLLMFLQQSYPESLPRTRIEHQEINEGRQGQIVAD